MRKIALICVAAIAILVIGWMVMNSLQDDSIETTYRDALFDRAIDEANRVQRYRQHIDTNTVVSDRAFSIQSVHDVDLLEGIASSTVQTSVELSQPTGWHQFVVNNILTSDGTFTKVSTDSETLSQTIPLTNGWRYFRTGSVTPRFTGIAMEAIQTHVLGLFQSGAPALEVTRPPTQEKLFGTSTWKYALGARNVQIGIPGTQSLLKRMMTGTSSVWIASSTGQVVQLHISNPPYRSTTTLSHRNNIATITPPIASDPLGDSQETTDLTE